MSKSAQFGRNLLLALILSVFILPVANAGLVEIYINNSEELTESETDFVIESGKDLNLEMCPMVLLLNEKGEDVSTARHRTFTKTQANKLHSD